MKNIQKRASGFLLLGLVASACSPDISQSPVPNPTPNPPAYNWSAQAAQGPDNLYDVFFIDNNHGWIGGASLTLLSTTDGGTSWPQVPSTGITRDLRSIFFVDAQTGWMASGSDTNPTDGHVFISQMGGAYPTQQVMANSPLNAIFFLDKNKGWAAGDSSLILQTDNHGTSWTPGSIGSHNNIYDIQFLTADIGWAATSDGIYRTKDGTTWQKQDLGASIDVRAIHFLDTLHAWGCGAGNTLLRKDLDSNNKVIWRKSTMAGEPVLTIWSDVFFTSNQTGWVVGTQGSIYKTTDGGITWTKESTGTHEDLNAIHMVSSSQGWAVGNAGTILTYTP